MDKAEAKELLQYHSFTHTDIQHPKMQLGFLGMLRPFNGDLIEENFREVMDCIFALAPEIEGKDCVDRQVVSCLWGICHLTQAWALYPDSMLQSNNLISKDQTQLLEKWVSMIFHTTNSLLEGNNLDTTLSLYNSLKEMHNETR